MEIISPDTNELNLLIVAMESKTIIIDCKPFVFVDESKELESGQLLNPISFEDGKIILETAKLLFNKIGVNFCLAYGTLLGAVREQSIIRGDEDVDVYTEDESKLLAGLPFLAENGFNLVRYYSGKLYSFRINERCYIDVYILRPLRYLSPWSIYCKCISGYTVPRKYFRYTQDIEFLGEIYKCPKDPEKLLKFWYGKNWRIPMPAKPHEEVLSAEIFHRIYRFIFRRA